MLVKYAVLRLLFATQLVSTNDMMADVFTKAVWTRIHSSGAACGCSMNPSRIAAVWERRCKRSRRRSVKHDYMQGHVGLEDERSWLGQEGALRQRCDGVAFTVSLVCVCVNLV